MEKQKNSNCKYLTINFIKREKGNIFIEILPITQSYSRPIAYKDHILLDGVVIIKFCKLWV